MVPSQAFGGRGPILMGVGWFESILGIILCLLRLYGASQKAGHIRWDFLWVALATLFAIASHACFTVSILHGMGNHVKRLTFAQVFQALHWTWISIFIGIIAVVFAKWAIIALILQVQGPNAKRRRYFLWGLGAWIAACAIIQICLSLTQCEPMEKLWNPTVEGICPRSVHAGNWSYFQGAIAVASDFVLALWPISIVWNLQTTFKVKLGFCALMAGGILPAVASIVRTILLPGLFTSTDITWDFGGFMVWSATELWAVIILGSIPPLRPLFLRFFSKVHTTVSSKTRSAFVTYGRGTHNGNTHNGTQHGVALQSMTKSQTDKKGPNMSSKPLGRTADGGSQENLTPPPGQGDLRGIYVSHEYEVDTGKWQGSTGGSTGGGSWYEGRDMV
ncbi:hypothetical protein CAC42_916 [Sphaceloma murrayae]|uniref:Rhodopsin domain-containing protein n=1 Tax=Sphaceloma murrayae TaxID=2082308 RepID=A0A2K1R2P0_9PEZI|nr:hypothetical protein CAC42_916 [Sphaceloma murrayae]